MDPRILFVAASLWLAGVTLAAVPCPRVTSEHNADVTELGRFREFARWKDKQGNDLAIAVWQYLCDTQTGLYHMNEVLDGNDPSGEYATVRDPLKLLNVYNVGYCGIFGPVLDGIFQGVGFEKGRSIGIPKWAHSTTEVWYDNAWHYLDLDIRGALLRRRHGRQSRRGSHSARAVDQPAAEDRTVLSQGRRQGQGVRDLPHQRH